ncbi:MAG TPA: hypothetical protein VMD53_19780 [Rhizomicrobium sp.]|nr:hypothetical protein [Rhizomicrobium sp.]
MTFVTLRRRTAIACLAGCIALLAAGTASARQWKATPEAMAQDYSLIQDSRPGNELVIVLWLSPQMVQDKDMQDILSKSLVIGALDAHIGTDGKVSFASVDGIALKDAQGNALRILKGDDIPPAVTGGVQTMDAMFRQTLGPVGAGFHWFVFEGASVKSCTPGSGFSVEVASQTYTYDTPIPGCPKN